LPILMINVTKNHNMCRYISRQVGRKGI